MQTQLTTFTASECEAITGVSQHLQRDWRRRGYLPAIEGKARFDAVVLGEMMALKALGDRGIGPQIAKQSSRLIGLSVAWAAIANPKSIQSDLQSIDIKIAARVAKLALARHIEEPLPPYFIIWADGFHDWAEDLGARFSMVHSSNRFVATVAPEISSMIAGAVVVVDTYALGDLLSRRAGKPLVTVQKA